MKTIHKIMAFLMLTALVPLTANAADTEAAKITVKDMILKAGEKGTLAVELVNPSFTVSAFQFDITLPSGLSIPLNEDDEYDAQLTARASQHTLMSNNVSTMIRFAVMGGLNNKVISGTSGTVLNIALKASKKFKGGEIAFSNIRITSEKGVQIAQDNFTVKINANEEESTEGVVLSVSNFSIPAGGTSNVAVNLTNPKFSPTLIQCDVTLPIGLNVASLTKTSRLTDSHTLKVNPIENVDNKYRLVILDATAQNLTINGTSGAIAEINFAADTTFRGGNISIENIKVINPWELVATPENIVIAVEATLGIDGVSTDKAMTGKVYNLQGVKVLENASSLEGLSKGIYIVNGKKVVKN